MKTCPACGATLTKRPAPADKNDSLTDREDAFRLLRLYVALCDSIHFLIPGRIDAIRLVIEGRDDTGAPTEWTFGRRQTTDGKS